MDKTSDAAKLERARSLANEAMFAVALQCRRLRSVEPEDNVFVFRYWFDLQFLIVALQRLHRAAKLAGHVPLVQRALEAFNKALPQLRKMRNVGEHIDEYAVEGGREKKVDRRMLQVGTWDGTTYEWLGESLNIDAAHDAANNLYRAVFLAAKSAGALSRTTQRAKS